MKPIQKTAEERDFIENKINIMIEKIGKIPIANRKIMPYGWRKAAKGRTVWRIVEEVISQNLEKYHLDLGFNSIEPAASEVGVYDFEFVLNEQTKSYVNIKSSVLGGKRNKDDISKGVGLVDFFSKNIDRDLYVATFIIDFEENMFVNIIECKVMPVAWIPDIYINPSNNGNLQSADYKYIEKSVRRTNKDFFDLLKIEMERAAEKRRKKRNQYT